MMPGIALQVHVTDGLSDSYLLPYLCTLTAVGWVNARTGKALMVTPTHWRIHVDTLPSTRAWARRSSKSRLRLTPTHPSQAPPSPLPAPATAESKLNEP
jgi:hypothetical protein